MEPGSQEALSRPVPGRGPLRESRPRELDPVDAGDGAAPAEQGNPGSAVERLCAFVNPIMMRLRRRSLFQKVVIINSALIVVGGLAGYYLEKRYFEDTELGLMALFFTSGVSLSILINFLMVKMAFRPLDDVNDAIKAIRAGHRGIRIPESTDDPQIEDLSRSLNRMINTMENARKRAAASVIKAQEEERRRIARELHDETSQSLTGLIIGIKMLEETAPASQPDLRERLFSIKDLAHQTLNEVHTMAVRLRPSILDDLGLPAALRSYAKEFSENIGIPVEVQLMALTERLTPELETVLYRVVQEALTNVARHSGATRCRVTLRRKENHVQGMIEDNGKGFDAAAAMASEDRGRGLGLHGMKERIELVGGSLEFDSRPGEGTSIFLEAPVRSGDGIW
ncbi:MAG: sensor histidine kinase [Actinobacteria bacterium]|nr:sensor histidine kinase [Actinomycetota bacterium]